MSTSYVGDGGPYCLSPATTSPVPPQAPDVPLHRVCGACIVGLLKDIPRGGFQHVESRGPEGEATIAGTAKGHSC